MPNLQQIQALRSKYHLSGNLSQGSREIKLLTESFNKNFSQIEAEFRLNGANRNYIEYFEQQRSADIVTLFIDITDFSKKMADKTNQQISLYLDNYYDKVIPLIYRHGGEIEKIIGDGIICIFGEPFLGLSKSDLFKVADSCAKDIVITMKNTDKEVKIALHDGTIMYYKNKTTNYPEYTMIGKPLTELFRLESVSFNNSINYYHVSAYNIKNYSETGVYATSDKSKHSHWTKSDYIKVDLKGVEWKLIKKTECTYKTL